MPQNLDLERCLFYINLDNITHYSHKNDTVFKTVLTDVPKKVLRILLQ